MFSPALYLHYICYQKQYLMKGICNNSVRRGACDTDSHSTVKQLNAPWMENSRGFIQIMLKTQVPSLQRRRALDVNYTLQACCVKSSVLGKEGMACG